MRNRKVRVHGLPYGFALVCAHGAVDSYQTIDIELKSIIYEIQNGFDLIEKRRRLGGRYYFVDEIELVVRANRLCTTIHVLPVHVRPHEKGLDIVE